MEEWTCYLDNLITTKERKITKMWWYYWKKYLSRVEPYPTYLKNPATRRRNNKAMGRNP